MANLFTCRCVCVLMSPLYKLRCCQCKQQDVTFCCKTWVPHPFMFCFFQSIQCFVCFCIWKHPILIKHSFLLSFVKSGEWKKNPDAFTLCKYLPLLFFLNLIGDIKIASLTGLYTLYCYSGHVLMVKSIELAKTSCLSCCALQYPSVATILMARYCLKLPLTQSNSRSSDYCDEPAVTVVVHSLKVDEEKADVRVVGVCVWCNTAFALFQLIVTALSIPINNNNKKKIQGCCPFIFVSITGGSWIYEGDKQVSHQQREPFYQS